ncbi:MAG: DoxX family protein [Chloroflexi bacterium]|nr:DoxX family protein [Chloroflexota bacterium]
MKVLDRKHALAIAFGRVVIGIVFLWAGLEKIIGEGLGTWSAKGFLEFATGGSLGWPFVAGEVAEGTIFNPTHDVWVALAGNEAAMTFIGYLVPLGQFGIGMALILGLLTRFGAAMGTLMMLVFFVAAWDFQFGIVNQHLTYAVVTLGLGVVGAGNYYGLDGIAGKRFGGAFRRWFLSGDVDEGWKAA